jgi:hypothetical protein
MVGLRNYSFCESCLYALLLIATNCCAVWSACGMSCFSVCQEFQAWQNTSTGNSFLVSGGPSKTMPDINNVCDTNQTNKTLPRIANGNADLYSCTANPNCNPSAGEISVVDPATVAQRVLLQRNAQVFKCTCP